MATQPLVIAKNKVRRALREMLICAATVSVLYLGADIVIGGPGNKIDGSGIFVLVLVGLMWSPLVWAIYRVGRFVINR